MSKGPASSRFVGIRQGLFSNSFFTVDLCNVLDQFDNFFYIIIFEHLNT